MVQTFYRKPVAQKCSGLGDSEFYEAIKEGRFPPPDAYLGPRSPVWTDETLANWQRQLISAHKTNQQNAATSTNLARSHKTHGLKCSEGRSPWRR